ncbi:MAG: MarR family transcriptional regulator [Firmicutes bacterium]|nr:MarR family transcriptional regulator [Bacillota bacterium]MCL5058454.1 MarR family transcriptional regulator [Actinomycetota bacterium]
MNGEVRDLREVIREELLMKDVILGAVKDGPRTVPEIASAIGRPSHEVLIWVMGLRRYGHLSETGEMTDEGYYRYGASAGEGS